MNDTDDLMSLLHAAGTRRNEGDGDGAYACYLDVWQRADTRGDDYHACIAAHMLGVTEPMSVQEKLHWHMESLNRADKVRDGRAAVFYASIYSNLGYVHVHLDRPEEALTFYHKAQHHTDVLEDDAYGERIRASIAFAITDLSAKNGAIVAPKRDNHTHGE